MKSGIVITIRTTENIELRSHLPEDLEREAAGNVLKLLLSDDPQLVGFEYAEIEGYPAHGRIWPSPADPEVIAYSYISVAIKDKGIFTRENYQRYEADIVGKVAGLFADGQLRFHSIEVRDRGLFEEVHLRFVE